MNQELINQYKIIHSTQDNYGSNVANFSIDDFVAFLSEHQCESILDFGCGKGNLINPLNELGFKCIGYDPAIEKFSKIPTGTNFDCVISMDVFEHLDLNCIEDEFKFLRKLSPKCMYINVSTRKAKQILPSGINAHTIIKNSEWWTDRFIKEFGDYNIASFINNKKKSVLFKLFL